MQADKAGRRRRQPPQQSPLLLPRPKPVVWPDTSARSTLPVLTSENHVEHAEWHRYFERIYGSPVRSIVDLNSFTWFYSFAPLPCDWVCTVRAIHPGWGDDAKPPDGTLMRFGGRDDSPEVILSRSGAFVKRPIDQALLDDVYVEILRTNHGDGARESGECWFYHTVGSGLWIKNEGVRHANGRYRHPVNDLPELVMPTPEGVNANDLDVGVGWGPRDDIQCVALVYDSKHALAREPTTSAES